MRECRYYGMCRSMACDHREDMDQIWDGTCVPCDGYRSMPDVESLKELASCLSEAAGNIRKRNWKNGNWKNGAPIWMLESSAEIISEAISDTRLCSQCNLCREVSMADGSRILVCDGGSDELEQVSETCLACDKFEEL